MERFMGKLIKVIIKHEAFARHETIVGRLLDCNRSLKTLELSNVVDFTSSYKLENNNIILFKKVVRLVTLDDEFRISLRSKLCLQEVDQIINLAKNLQYIDQHDEKFRLAMEHLRVRKEIAIFLDGELRPEEAHKSLIAVATHTKVYIFDLRSLEHHTDELFALITSNHPRKVIFGCRQYLTQLHRLNIKLVKTSGIIDLAGRFKRSGSYAMPMDFLEAICACFNISPVFLVTDNHYPYSRPLKQDILEMIAKRTILQLKLRRFYLQNNNVKRRV